MVETACKASDLDSFDAIIDDAKRDPEILMLSNPDYVAAFHKDDTKLVDALKRLGECRQALTKPR